MDGNKRFMGTVILILQRIDVHDFHGGVPPGKLMERIRAFWGSFPSFLVFSISTSLIFSRPNAKGRCPPPFRSRKSWLMSLKSGHEQWILFPLQFATFFISFCSKLLRLRPSYFIYILDKVIRDINYRL